ncbi:hypothetical protein L211DRAFT_867250 [Terfezia boudieri ATCC MYA-4762]|uniref:HMG box domain-containing protein n=1 Tax=Terfezia boudieri ATCC MYA-4762 TaxID=1051890 RepID=A0A3N4LVN2_9PEZI|nr:hypothetical protein L211DRAFT_867250 [Terfezia boudieri ATCC MYA-4762]
MPPRKDPAANASSSMNVAAANGPGSGTLTRETLEELENKRDAFVEAMNTLSYAAKTAARTGYDYFNVLASASASAAPSLLPPDLTPHVHANGFIPINYNAHVRATSAAPADTRARPAAMLPTAVEEDGEEPADDGTAKKKRKRGPAKKDKKDMDPDAPKKPISAYFQFVAVARPIIKQDMGEGISAKEVMTEAASRWGALPVEEKQVWHAQHHQQMVKWYIDTNAYRASKGLPLESVPKDYQPGANPTNVPPAAPGEDEEEEPTSTPDEADEDEDEDEEESPTTPPPAKKARVTPKQNGAAAAAAAATDSTPTTTTAPVPKKRGRPPKDRSATSTNAPAPAPATPTTTTAASTTTTAQADQPATPDTAKRTRAPSIKAKEAKELALAKAPTTRSPSKNTNTNTPTTNTAGADAAEKQVQDEAEGSITVMGSGGGGGAGAGTGVGAGAGLNMRSMETVGSMKEKRERRERKKRRGKGEEE